MTLRPASPALAYLFYRFHRVHLQIVMPAKTTPTVNLWTVTVAINGGTPTVVTSIGGAVLIPVKPGDSGTVSIVQSSPGGGASRASDPVPFTVPMELPPPQPLPPVLSFEP